jgi:ketosteroid isomerase-like protein
MFKKWILLCCAVACSMVIAQGAAAAPLTDEQEVAAAVENLRVAMSRPANAKALDELVMNELSYGHSHGAVQDKSQFIADLTNGSSDFVSITLSDQTIKVVQDVAIVRHTLDAVTNDFGKPGTVSMKILLIWKKSDGHWRLLARQAVHAK